MSRRFFRDLERNGETTMGKEKKKGEGKKKVLLHLYRNELF